MSESMSHHPENRTSTRTIEGVRVEDFSSAVPTIRRTLGENVMIDTGKGKVDGEPVTVLTDVESGREIVILTRHLQAGKEKDAQLETKAEQPIREELGDDALHAAGVSVEEPTRADGFDGRNRPRAEVWKETGITPQQPDSLPWDSIK